MVMEIMVNAIVEYCLLLSLFVDLTRQAHFFSVYFSRLARLLSSTFVYFTCIRVVFFSRRKKIINTTFLYVATVTLLYLRIE